MAYLNENKIKKPQEILIKYLPGFYPSVYTINCAFSLGPASYKLRNPRKLKYKLFIICKVETYKFTLA